jgi:hypothetical protein
MQLFNYRWSMITVGANVLATYSKLQATDQFAMCDAGADLWFDVGP